MRRFLFSFCQNHRLHLHQMVTIHVFSAGKVHDMFNGQQESNFDVPMLLCWTLHCFCSRLRS